MLGCAMPRDVSATRISAAVVAAAFLLGTPRSACAQPASGPTGTHTKTSSLSWTRLEGAQGCIGTRDLARAVEAILGHPVFVSASQAELSIEGRAESRPGGGFRVVLSASNRSGELLGSRELSTDERDCGAINEPVALAIALMVDPDAALSSEPSAEPKPPPPVREPEPKVIEKRVPVYVPVRVEQPAPKTLPIWQGDLFAAVAVGAGYLPRPSVAAVAGASLEAPHFVPLEATLTVFLPQEQKAARGATVSFFLARGGLLVCPLAKRGETFVARLCGGAEAGLITAAGEGFDADGAGVRGQLALSARARLSARIVGPLAVTGAAAASAPLGRERFVYHEATGAKVELFRVPAFGAQGELGLELRFP